MLAYSIRPGYARKKPVVQPKLGPWPGIIDQILEDEKTQHKKQRHTAKRIPVDCSRTICLRPGSDVPARATTRGM
jgi:hypothetical protein